MMRLSLALAGLILLAGCGIQGDLTPAPPMWGDAREEYKAAHPDAAPAAAEEDEEEEEAAPAEASPAPQ